MNKVYQFPTEGTNDYLVEVTKWNWNKKKSLIIFNASVTPPTGHSVQLVNIQYNPREQKYNIPRGSGFEIQPSRRLQKKLSTICHDLWQQYKKKNIKAKQTQIKPQTVQKTAPELFDRNTFGQTKKEFKGE